MALNLHVNADKTSNNNNENNQYFVQKNLLTLYKIILYIIIIIWRWFFLWWKLNETSESYLLNTMVFFALSISHKIVKKNKVMSPITVNDELRAVCPELSWGWWWVWAVLLLCDEVSGRLWWGWWFGLLWSLWRWWPLTSFEDDTKETLGLTGLDEVVSAAEAISSTISQ